MILVGRKETSSCRLVNSFWIGVERPAGLSVFANNVPRLVTPRETASISREIRQKKIYFSHASMVLAIQTPCNNNAVKSDSLSQFEIGRCLPQSP